MINTFINIAYFLGVILLFFLSVKFIYGLIKKDKSVYLKNLRLLLNFGILFTFCWSAFMSLALVVRPPFNITKSKEQSLEQLSQWIINQELKIGLLGILIISVLGYFNYLYQQKVENVNMGKPIFNIILVNCFIVIISLFLIYGYTYGGLAVEVGYHFK